MLIYESVYTYYNGTFPNLLGKNSTGPTTKDGTEFIADFVSELWGVFQFAVDYSGLTRNGLLEGVTNGSQIHEGLMKGFGVGPGVGVLWFGSTDPASAGYRVLLLQGQGVDVSSYPELVDATYVGDGDNAAVGAAFASNGNGAFFKSNTSDGLDPSTSGSYLILPDGRGRTIRGDDAGALVDPDGASRYLGGVQADAMQRITGEIGAPEAVTAGIFSEGTQSGALSVSGDLIEEAKITSEFSSGDNWTRMSLDSSGSTSPNPAKTDDEETRMANIQVRLAITY